MQQDTTGSTHGARADGTATVTEVLIIGFGLSAIPLIRELERDGIGYVIISQGESIWERLERHGRLDFDLVSSVHTSLYSFELVNRDPADRYPTSREFLAFVRKYLTLYGSKAMTDWVVSVENNPSHTIVRTRGGRVFEAKHLVISTAFRRRMNQLLNDFDYASVRNQTIAITAMGDSVNLMISKLIPHDNRVVLITNGFMMLDKLSFYDGTSYTLDQLEYHNMRHVSKMLYRKTITTGLEFVVLCRMLFGFPAIDSFYFKHPLAIRRFRASLRSLWGSPLPNGIIAIKYWPIDSYQTLFDNGSLEQSIREGYLLNDIAFYLEQGLVELWPKQETVIDREARTIRWKDKVIRCDHIIDADYEVPNLPEIAVTRAGSSKQQYEYVCRNNFMGVVPRELRNVYLIGIIRPTTGGLNNIIEMQCLLVHKMIADPNFSREIYGDIERRIEKYNHHYHPLDEVRPTDHLVHYGFYTDDIARLLKIGPRLSDCRSLKDLVMYFIFPNTAFKFRQAGPYEVAGVRQMVQRIYENHKGFSVIMNYLLTYALLQLTAYVAIIVAAFQQSIPLPAVAVPFLLLIVLLNPLTAFVAANGFGRNSYVNIVLAAGLVLTAFWTSPLVPVASFLAACGLTFLLRRLGWTRAPFNDLKNKKNPKYREFFGRYCAAFREVFSEVGAPARQPSARGSLDQASSGTTRVAAR